MEIQIVTSTSEELWEALQKLVPMLTSAHPAPSPEELADLVKSDSSIMLAARGEQNRIVGTACLTVYRVPTGMRAIVEDVIVDESARGKGIGEALVRRCLEIARERGAPGVSLTSNPRREAANRLYLRIGFERRQTNPYYFRF